MQKTVLSKRTQSLGSYFCAGQVSLVSTFVGTISTSNRSVCFKGGVCEEEYSRAACSVAGFPGEV